jgi:hypothetical protein
MDQRFAFSPADLARVKTVQFGILSPDEIVSVSGESAVDDVASRMLQLGAVFRAYCVWRLGRVWLGFYGVAPWWWFDELGLLRSS